MQLHITGRHFEVTQALKEFTEDKFKKLKHFYDAITQVNIIFQVEHHDHIAAGTILSPGHEFHAEAKTIDMYQSVDELLEKLMTQIKKHKEQERDH